MKKIIGTGLFVCMLVSVSFGAKIAEGFESKEILKKMEIEGDVVISGDQFHGGKTALYVPENSQAIFTIGTENKFGTASFWVYDSCNCKTEATAPLGWGGPFFGLVNADGDKVVLWAQSSKGVKFGTGYAVTFTAENQWFTKWWSKITRGKAGWNKYTFTCTDEKTLSVTQNDEKEVSSISEKVEFFNKGFTGIIMAGGKSPADMGKKKAAPVKKAKKGAEKAEAPVAEETKVAPTGEKFYLDDIEVETKDATPAPAK